MSDIFPKALMEVQEQIATKVALRDALTAEISQLKATEIALKNTIRLSVKNENQSA